jgi:hypothetical protein
MFDERVAECLRLCEHAKSLHGEELHAVLAEIAGIIDGLKQQAPDPAGAILEVHARILSQLHEPIITTSKGRKCPSYSSITADL